MRRVWWLRNGKGVVSRDGDLGYCPEIFGNLMCKMGCFVAKIAL